MISLSVLAQRLSSSVPVRDGVPPDYERLVQDAIQQLSTDVPMVTTTLLLINQGVANYPLPADFLYAIDFSAPVSQGGVIISDRGLIPVPKGFSEQHYFEGTSLRIYPVPNYTMSRVLRYASLHVLNGQGVYEKLNENAARIALIYARYLALMEQAAAASSNGWSYKIGDESVDKSKVGASLQAQAGEALKNYENALRPIKSYTTRYRGSRNMVDV